MRIAYYADSTSPHTEKWLKYFIDQRYDVHLLGWSYPSDYLIDSLNYHHLPSELPKKVFPRPIGSILRHVGLGDLILGIQIKKILQSIQPDILDILMINRPEIFIALSWEGNLVITPWGSDLLVYPQGYSWIMRYLLKLALLRADLVLCNSAHLESAAMKWGARPEKLRRVGQIIDLGLFRSGINPEPIRKQFGIIGYPVILSPRNIRENYRIHNILQAFKIVLEDFPEARLVQLGRKDNIDYVQFLESEIDRLGIRKSVVFTGWQDNHIIPQILAASDIVISVPASDSCPASVFEAMACEKPVIASDLAPLREIIVDGKTGLLVPLDNPQALSQAIVRLLKDANLKQRIVTEARLYIQREGDYRRQMERVARFYDEILIKQERKPFK